MKMLKAILVMAAVLVLLPATSYAIVDFGAYGGYGFAGKLDTGELATNTVEKQGKSMSGWEYGLFGHLNTSIAGIVGVGVGPYYQAAPMQYELEGNKYDAKRVAYGVDLMVSLELIPIIHPYLREGVAIKEQIKVEVPSAVGMTTKTTNDRYFRSWYFGFGCAFTVAPMVRVFGEYLYTTSKQENKVEIKGNAVHAGAMLKL